MTNTLQWTIADEQFEDGSLLKDWIRIEESGVWHWQYDTHELSFDIYEHDAQFWKLYRIRYVPEGESEYAHSFGGQACRVVLVSYKSRARSPHSRRLMSVGDREWVRTYEVDETIHTVLKSGETAPKYGAPFTPKREAA